MRRPCRYPHNYQPHAIGRWWRSRRACRTYRRTGGRSIDDRATRQRCRPSHPAPECNERVDPTLTPVTKAKTNPDVTTTARGGCNIKVQRSGIPERCTLMLQPPRAVVVTSGLVLAFVTGVRVGSTLSLHSGAGCDGRHRCLVALSSMLR